MNKRGRYFVACAIGAIVMGQSGMAAAQTQPAEAQGDAPAQEAPNRVPERSAPEARDQDIIVTGSRLRSPTLTAPSPLQVIDQQQIKREGFINIIDAIQQNPAFGNPGTSRTTSNGSRTGTGGNQVGLRNGGPDLTLMLIDGRRTMNNEVGFIPTGFVERVEILTGGASAVYGSDALIGVVNYIYKKNWEGMQMNAQAGLSERGDNQEYQADFTIGRNFADGRGNALFYVGWSDQAFVSAANRPFSAGGFTSLGTTQRVGAQSDANLIAAQNLNVPIGIYGQVTGAGLFTVNRQPFTVAADGTARAPLPSETYNGAPFGALANPLERFNTAARVNYELTENVNFFAQGTFARTKTRAYSNPLGLNSAGGISIFGNGGVYNIESYVTAANGVNTRVRNAFVPNAIYNAAVDSNNDGLRDISFARRMNEYGNFTSDQERESFQVTFGAEGDLGKWHYEAYYSYGVARANQFSPNAVNADRLAQALDAIVDTTDLNRNGNTTEIICASAIARASGCVPANVFGEGRISADAVAWTKAGIMRDARQSLQDFQVNFSGPLAKLWSAGPIEVVVGAEHRRETSAEIFDPLANAGRNGFAQQTNTSGAITISEAYGEIQIPLIHNTPFIQNLTLRGAARASKYSQLTSTFVGWNGGFEWSPVKDIRFRGTHAYAIRAPTINNLFRPTQVTIDNGSVDPCIGVTATGTDVRSVNCRRDPLVVANINANNGVFVANVNDRGGSVTTTTLPNPNLREQYAHTTTVGAVINPTSIHALRNLTLTGDFYKVKISGGIGGQSLQQAAALCYNQSFDEWCSLISRRSAATGPYSIGTIEAYQGRLLNGTGERLIEGLDFTASYFTSLDNIGMGGRLGFSASYSHLLRSYSTPVRGAARRNLKGEMGTPSDPASGSISYDDKTFGLTISGNYVPPFFHEQPFRAGFVMANGQQVDRKYFRIPPRVYLNLQTRVKVADKYEMFFGVRNLTDKQPFVLYSGLPGTGYVYDPFGRRYYAGLRLSM